MKSNNLQLKRKRDQFHVEYEDEHLLYIKKKKRTNKSTNVEFKKNHDDHTDNNIIINDSIDMIQKYMKTNKNDCWLEDAITLYNCLNMMNSNDDVHFIFPSLLIYYIVNKNCNYKKLKTPNFFDKIIMVCEEEKKNKKQIVVDDDDDDDDDNILTMIKIENVLLLSNGMDNKMSKKLYGNHMNIKILRIFMNFHSLKQSFIDIQNDQQHQQQNIESIPFQLLKRFIQKNDEKKLHFLELGMCFVDIHMYIAMIAKKISSKLKNTSLNRFDDYMIYPKNEKISYLIIKREFWEYLKSEWLKYYDLSSPIYPLMLRSCVLSTGNVYCDRLRKYNVFSVLLNWLWNKKVSFVQYMLNPYDEDFDFYDQLFFILEKWNTTNQDIEDDCFGLSGIINIVEQAFRSIIRDHMKNLSTQKKKSRNLKDNNNQTLNAFEMNNNNNNDDNNNNQITILTAIRDFLLLKKPHAIKKSAVIKLESLFRRGTNLKNKQKTLCSPKQYPIIKKFISIFKLEYNFINENNNFLIPLVIPFSIDHNGRMWSKEEDLKDTNNNKKMGIEFLKEYYHLCASEYITKKFSQELFLSMCTFDMNGKSSEPNYRRNIENLLNKISYKQLYCNIETISSNLKTSPISIKIKYYSKYFKKRVNFMNIIDIDFFNFLSNKYTHQNQNHVKKPQMQHGFENKVDKHKKKIFKNILLSEWMERNLLFSSFELTHNMAETFGSFLALIEYGFLKVSSVWCSKNKKIIYERLKTMYDNNHLNLDDGILPISCRDIVNSKYSHFVLTTNNKAKCSTKNNNENLFIENNFFILTRFNMKKMFKDQKKTKENLENLEKFDDCDNFSQITSREKIPRVVLEMFILIFYYYYLL